MACDLWYQVYLVKPQIGGRVAHVLVTGRMIRRRHSLPTTVFVAVLAFSLAFQVCAPGFHYALAHAAKSCDAHGGCETGDPRATHSDDSDKSHGECLVCAAIAHQSRNATVTPCVDTSPIVQLLTAEPFTTCLDLPRPSLLTHAGRAPPTFS